MNEEQAPSFETAAKTLTPELLSRFRQALELGRWPDGRKVTAEQKTLLMESVILAESAQGVPEHLRTGYIDSTKRKQKKADLIHRESP